MVEEEPLLVLQAEDMSASAGEAPGGLWVLDMQGGRKGVFSSGSCPSVVRERQHPEVRQCWVASSGGSSSSSSSKDLWERSALQSNGGA